VRYEQLGDGPIAVLNGGGRGTALALLLHRAGRKVRLWVRRPEAASRLLQERENAAYLPGVPLPEDLAVSADLAATVEGCPVVVVAVISRYMREIAGRLAPCLAPDALVVHGTKGFEAESWLRCSEILASELGSEAESRLAVLSGPTHAPEVARAIPTAAVLGCRDPVAAAALQRLFAGPDFRLYTNPDLTGVEVCGSLKNVIALAAGASDGLGYGDNTKAALITRSLAEMGRLVAALGGDPDTVSGLAGLGDVVVTCTSRHSRNRWAGEQLGRGQTLEQVLASTPMVVEGVPATRAAVALGARHGVELPIAEQVQAVLFEGRRPLDALAALMGREPRRER
jgi:glycerol-3-phosphate dehydrogenase (NAD(P)+)